MFLLYFTVEPGLVALEGPRGHFGTPLGVPLEAFRGLREPKVTSFLEVLEWILLFSRVFLQHLSLTVRLVTLSAAKGPL